MKSERENQYCILTHLWNLENGISELITGRQCRHRLENGFVDTRGRKEVNEWRKWHPHMYTIRYKIDSWGEVPIERKELSSAPCDDLEGQDGGRWGR